jgi:hypothetical protein
MLAWLRSLTDAILGKVPGKPDRLDSATRMARDADFSGRGEHPTLDCEPPPDVDSIEELMRIAANPTRPVDPGRSRRDRARQHRSGTKTPRTQ